MPRKLNNALGGQMLLQNMSTRTVWYIVFCFLLIIIYISLHYGIEKTMLEVRHMERELKVLKVEYTSRNATLMNLSQERNVALQLKKYHSGVHAPTVPPQWIPHRAEKEERHE